VYKRQVFNYIAESDVTLSPGFNRDTPKPFAVSGSKSFIYPVTAGTRLAMLVYVRSEEINAEAAGTTTNFSGGVTILFD